MNRLSDIATVTAIADLVVDEYRNVQDLLRRVLLKANELIGSDIAFISLVEDGGKELVHQAHTLVGIAARRWRKHYVERLRIGGIELRKGGRSFTGYVAHTRRSRRTGDVSRERFYLASNDEIRSELAVPIVLDGELLGVINLESKTSHFYTREHQDILVLVARLIARPLEALMRREGLRRPLGSVLERIAQRLNDVPPGVPIEASKVLDEVATIVAETLRSRTCTIWLLNDDRRELVLRGAHGPHRRFVNLHHERAGETLAWRALTQGALLKYGSPYPRDKVSGRFDLAVYGRRLTTPFMIAPMLVCGEPIGVIKVGLKRHTSDSRGGQYTAADAQMLSVLQGQVASAIKVRRLEFSQDEAALGRVRQQSQLIELFGDLDLKTLLAKAVRKIPELCNGIHCSIFLWEESRDAFVLAASKSLAPELVGDALYSRGEGLTGWVGHHGRPVILDTRNAEALRSIHPDLEWKPKYHEGGGASERRRPFLAVPIFLNGQSVGVIRVVDRTTGFFTESDAQLVALAAGHVSTAIAYCRRYEEKLKLLKGLQSLLVLTHGITALDAGVEAFEEAVMQEAADSAAQVLRTDVLSLYKYRADHGTFDTPPVWKGDVRHPEFMKTPIHSEDLPWVIWHQGTRYWEDVPADDALMGTAPARDGLPRRSRFAAREGTVSCAGIRLEVGERAVGVMFLNFRTRQVFDREKQEIIETFARHIALCLEIARLYRQVREFASRQEADHLAQELHDSLQIFSSDVLRGAGLALHFVGKRDLANARSQLVRLERAATYAVEEYQAIMHLLKTHVVDDLGLPEALRRLSGSMGSHGLEPDLEVEVSQRLSKDLQRHLYRLAQAALHNVVKHAHAQHVKIRVVSTPDKVALSVEDDGQGFDAKAALHDRGHYGLYGIRWRVEKLLGGRVQFLSSPGKGTKVYVEIPGELSET